MIVYWSLFIGTILLLWFASKTNVCYTLNTNWNINEQRINKYALFIICIPMIFFLGLRSNVGDTIGYINSFNRVSTEFNLNSLDDRAYGFSILQKFCKAYLFDDASIWLLLIFLISIIPIIIILSKHSPSILISFFVFFASTEFIFLINGSRQFIAVSICFYAFKYLINKNPVKYYAFVLIAMSFHMTAIIMLIAYPIANMKPFKGKIFIFIILAITLTLYSDEFLVFINDNFVGESVYGHYMIGLTETEGVNIFRVLTQWVPVAIAYAYRKKIYEIDDRCTNICVNLSLINAFVFTFASTVGGNLTGRMAEYFTIYNLLLYPILFVRCVSKRTKQWLLPVFAIMYIAFFIFQMEIAWNGLVYESDLLNIYC